MPQIEKHCDGSVALIVRFGISLCNPALANKTVPLFLFVSWAVCKGLDDSSNNGPDTEYGLISLANIAFQNLQIKLLNIPH